MHVQQMENAKCTSTGLNVANWLLKDVTLKINRIRYLKGTNEENVRSDGLLTSILPAYVNPKQFKTFGI